MSSMYSPDASFGEENHKHEVPLEAPKPANKTPETIEVEPRFQQLQEDLQFMFTIHIEDETMLENPYLKNELFTKVKEGLINNEYFALDYMAHESLHIDGEPLLTKEDCIKRGIRSLQDHGTKILHMYSEPRLGRVKELFIKTGMFTEEELEQELHHTFH